eukprot:452830_1
MTHLIHEYNSSKYSRRIKSRHKSKQKTQLQFKRNNCCRDKRTPYKHKSNKIPISSNNLLKEWILSENRNTMSCLNTMEELPTEGEGYDSSLTGSAQDYTNSSAKHINKFPEFYEFLSIPTFEADNKKIFRCKLSILLSKRFTNIDLKNIPFDMLNFNDQCLFWYHILDKLGIITHLFSLQYVLNIDPNAKCEWLSDEEWHWNYTDLFFVILKRMLNTKHIFYILDKITSIVSNEIKRAKKVVMNRKMLVNILTNNDSHYIGIDLCSMIAAFTMNTNDILHSYLRNERFYNTLKTYNYNINNHKIIYQTIGAHDHYYRCEVVRPIISVTYDGKDISETFKFCKKQLKDYSSNETLLFHKGKYNHTFNLILKIVWFKFKQYCVYQNSNNFEIKYAVLYSILLYYVDNIIVCKQDLALKTVTCKNIKHYIKEKGDYKIWKRAYYNTKYQPLLQNLLLMINKCVKIYKKYIKRIYTFGTLKQQLIENSIANDTHFNEYCELIKRNFYYSHEFLDFFDDHRRHKEWWCEIWNEMLPYINTIKMKHLFCLMVTHCQNYKANVVNKRNDMYKFDISEFIFNDILPIIIEKAYKKTNIELNPYWFSMSIPEFINDNKIKEHVLACLKQQFCHRMMKGILPYNELIQTIYCLRKIIDDEQIKQCEMNIVNMKEYCSDKYCRNYQSRMKYLKKNKVKRKYCAQKREKFKRNKMSRCNKKLSLLRF